MTNSEVLRARIQLCLGALARSSESIFSSPEISQFYPYYLLNLHWIVRASVPLMQRAHAAAKQQSGNGVYAHLSGYLAKHIQDETDHDRWLLEDLSVINIAPEIAIQQIPTAEAAALVGSQYYWIEHYDPLAILGYIAVLEGYPISLDHVIQMEMKTQFPSSAFRTLRVHSSLDKNHRNDLFSFMDEVQIDPAMMAIITRSAIATVKLTASLLDSIPKFHHSTLKLIDQVEQSLQ